MASGVIARLMIDKGFGFIRPDGQQGEDVFFHKTSLEDGGFDSLDVGTPVTFTVGQSPKGPRAERVRISGS